MLMILMTIFKMSFRLKQVNGTFIWTFVNSEEKIVITYFKKLVSRRLNKDFLIQLLHRWFWRYINSINKQQKIRSRISYITLKSISVPKYLCRWSFCFIYPISLLFKCFLTGSKYNENVTLGSKQKTRWQDEDNKSC